MVPLSDVLRVATGLIGAPVLIHCASSIHLREGKTMRHVASWVLLAGLCLATACGGDDGGNGPAGGQDTRSPETAADVAVDLQADLAADSQVEDTANPDVAIDTSGLDTPICQDPCNPVNGKECADDTSYHVCAPSGGCLAWGAPVACGDGNVCEAGECIPDEPDCTGVADSCEPLDAKRCAPSGAATQVCWANADGCPVWTFLEECGEGQACSNGACTGGSADCSTLQTCVGVNCAAEVASGSQIKLTSCTLENCHADYEACYGAFGSGACKDLLKCAQACQDPTCQQGCMASASYDANVQFLAVGVCMEDNCPDALTNPMANIGCITGTCGTQLNACCGGSFMGCM